MREAKQILIAAPLALALLLSLSMVFPDLVSRLVPRFLYFPERLSEADADPARWGLAGAEQVFFRASDGTRLHGWWVPAAGRPRGAAIYFHGNAGHRAGRAPIAERLRALNVDVLLFDFRGYGRSDGTPSEQGLFLDGRAAYDFVVQKRGVPRERVLLLGHSLGGAVAVSVASEVDAAGLVVTSTFRNLPSIARRLYTWLPGRVFSWTTNRFDSEARVPGVGMPILVGWGSGDEFIPRAETRALYEAATRPRRWVQIEGAGHNDLWWDARLWTALERFFAETLDAGGAGR
jgi:pimeloyl-ACP methyl ester carboxylesterase